jgi:hypothetical protein
MTRFTVYRAELPNGPDRYGFRNEGSGMDYRYPSCELMLEALAEKVEVHRKTLNSLKLEFAPESGIIVTGGEVPLRYKPLAPAQAEAVWVLVATPYRFAEVS